MQMLVIFDPFDFNFFLLGALGPRLKWTVPLSKTLPLLRPILQRTKANENKSTDATPSMRTRLTQPNRRTREHIMITSSSCAKTRHIPSTLKRTPVSASPSDALKPGETKRRYEGAVKADFHADQSQSHLTQQTTQQRQRSRSHHFFVSRSRLSRSPHVGGSIAVEH